MKKSKSLKLFKKFVKSVQSDVSNSIKKVFSSDGNYVGYKTANNNIFVFNIKDGHMWFWGIENEQSKWLLR